MKNDTQGILAKRRVVKVTGKGEGGARKLEKGAEGARGKKSAKESLIGLVFNRLTVLSRAVLPLGDKRRGRGLLECKCSCGKGVLSRLCDLKSGRVKSCGCWHREAMAKRLTTHGMARSPIYKTWQGMVDRCRNPRCPMFHLYGGRGIRVCRRWLKFENFSADVGPRPLGKSLDRFPDKNGNYEAGNVRWATPVEQCNNQRKNRLVTHNGETHSIAEWARLRNISPNVLWRRIVVRGFSLQKATERKYKRYEHMK